MTDLADRPDAGWPATPEAFREMMRGFPSGVAVVTTTDPAGVPWGLTCSSMCSVSLSPPTLLVCLRAASPTLAAIVASGAFAVNLLHERAQPTAEVFASGCPDRFALVAWEAPAGAAGPHLSTDVRTVADCRLDRDVRMGDHVVVFGRVQRVSKRQDSPPLIYGMRRFLPWPA